MRYIDFEAQIYEKTGNDSAFMKILSKFARYEYYETHRFIYIYGK